MARINHRDGKVLSGISCLKRRHLRSFVSDVGAARQKSGRCDLENINMGQWKFQALVMLIDPRTIGLRDSPDLRLTEMNKKSRTVLKALAAGRSCEQILARDQTLTSHDIFHALSEAPTRLWRKKQEPKREPRASVD